MPIKLNHTIVQSRDKRAGADFLTTLFGLSAAEPWGPFLTVAVANEVTLDYLEFDGDPSPQHYCFLVSDEEFDQIFGRITERGLPHWAEHVFVPAIDLTCVDHCHPGSNTVRPSAASPSSTRSIRASSEGLVSRAGRSACAAIACADASGAMAALPAPRLRDWLIYPYDGATPRTLSRRATDPPPPSQAFGRSASTTASASLTHYDECKILML